MQGNVLCSPSLGPPPDEWVSREGPNSTSRMGKLRNEEARRPARGLAERPEALAAEDQELLLTSRLPPPLRWCRRASVPQPPTHTPPPRGAARLRRFQGQGQKTGLRALPPRFVARERWERACLQSNMAAPRPPPPPASLGPEAFPRRPPVGGKTARTRRTPPRCCRCSPEASPTRHA